MLLSQTMDKALIYLANMVLQEFALDQRPTVLGSKGSACLLPINVYPDISLSTVVVLVLNARNVPPRSLHTCLALPRPCTSTGMTFSGNSCWLVLPCWPPLMILPAYWSQILVPSSLLLPCLFPGISRRNFWAPLVSQKVLKSQVLYEHGHWRCRCSSKEIDIIYIAWTVLQCIRITLYCTWLRGAG